MNPESNGKVSCGAISIVFAPWVIPVFQLRHEIEVIRQSSNDAKLDILTLSWTVILIAQSLSN